MLSACHYYIIKHIKIYDSYKALTYFFSQKSIKTKRLLQISKAFSTLLCHNRLLSRKGNDSLSIVSFSSYSITTKVCTPFPFFLILELNVKSLIINRLKTKKNHVRQAGAVCYKFWCILFSSLSLSVSS